VVLLDHRGQEVGDAVVALLDQLEQRGGLDSDQRRRAQQRIVERERQSSTAIGRAVTVPHALLPDLDAPVVCIARLVHPINVGAPDGRPVRFVFLLLAPESRAELHLELLVATSRLISDDGVVAALNLASDSEHVRRATDEFFVRIAERKGRAATPAAAEGLVRTGRFAGGLVEDVKRRWVHYGSDLTDGLHPKALAATLFLFFACLAPAIAFGGLMYKLTGGAIGATEMIVATAVGGVVYAFGAGQPLTILGGTGPLLVFTAVLYDLCLQLGLPFLPTYAWVGLWTALLTLLIALLDASALIRYCTRFTDEIFALLISAIFVYESVKDILQAFYDPAVEPYTALLSMILAIGTYVIAINLRDFRKSVYLRPQIREFLADFGSVIAISSMIFVAWWVGQTDLVMLVVPDGFGTTTGRPWLVDLWQVPTWVIPAAAIPAVLCTVLVYLDQNITSRLINQKDNRLRKGPGYHLDLAMVAVLLAFSSLFGLPWLVAATVRSLNHLRALATMEESIRQGEVHDHIVHVRETRVTGIAIHVLIGLSVFLFPALTALGIQIPMPVLFGLFLFMGLSSLSGNQFWERLKLWAKEPALYPKTHYVRRVPLRDLHAYTAIQLACLAVLWVVKTSVLALLFPLVIALLVPVRLFLGRFFPSVVLQVLDSEEEPEEELMREAGA
jgi:mannitol/fructose-specific phosphotransferase system IIA component (Ntr-type)